MLNRENKTEEYWQKFAEEVKTRPFPVQKCEVVCPKCLTVYTKLHPSGFCASCEWKLLQDRNIERAKKEKDWAIQQKNNKRISKEHECPEEFQR